MEAAATSLQGQLQTVQRSMEDLYTSQMANRDHESILLRQFAGEMAAIRNSQALLADLVEKTEEEARAQRATSANQGGGVVNYGDYNQGFMMRDSSGTINYAPPKP
jgi:hypothetical protein